MKQLWQYSVEELAERCAVAESEVERLRVICKDKADLLDVWRPSIERLTARNDELVEALHKLQVCDIDNEAQGIIRSILLDDALRQPTDADVRAAVGIGALDAATEPEGK